MNHCANSTTPKCPAAFQYLWRAASLGVLLLWPVSNSLAQHADIALYLNASGQLTTHESSQSSQPERQLFQRNFDFFGPPLGIYAGDDPGLQMSGNSAPAGYTNLVPQQRIDLSLVPLHIPGQALGNLLYWDGIAVDVEFSSVPAGLTLTIEDATGDEFSLDGSRTRFDGLVAGQTDSRGGMHDHLAYVLERTAGTPPRGYYLMGWRYAAAGLDPAQRILVGLTNTGLSGTSRGNSWLAENLDRITIAGDFDNNGAYELHDVDLLTAAIADVSHEDTFDLTLDGQVTLADLDLWRELAGHVLYPTGEPVFPGDANLDGAVDGLDFNIWNSHKSQPISAWSAGDFDGSGVPDADDLALWNDYRFRSAHAGAPFASIVPEPAGFVGQCVMYFAAALLAARSRLVYSQGLGLRQEGASVRYGSFR